MFNKKYISKSFATIKANLPSNIILLAVSKYQSLDKIKYLHSLGQNSFGENYLQELEQKATILPNLDWHFIGSIQSRKIKHIVKYANTIQSVEKFEQLEKINSHANRLEKNIDVFLQVNIDDDPNKSGFSSTEKNSILNCINNASSLSNIKITGLMCLPAKPDTSETSFIKMKSFFDSINTQLNTQNKLTKLSMGMSTDYREAIKYGSTIVRIGSSLFGERQKAK